MPSPMQTLLDYILAMYTHLDTRCNLRSSPVDDGECVRCCRSSYYGRSGAIQYQCCNSKKVYLVRYVASRVQEVRTALGGVARECTVSKTNIMAMSLGGGPGAEALALMDLMSNHVGQYDLGVYNFDVEPTWGLFFDDLTHRYAGIVDNVRLQTRFYSRNLQGSLGSLGGPYDLVFVSWLLSELPEQGRRNVVGSLAQLVKTDGFAVIADRFEEGLVQSIDDIIAEQASLILPERGRHVGHCGVAFPDDVRDAFYVRLNADAQYWVLQTF